MPSQRYDGEPGHSVEEAALISDLEIERRMPKLLGRAKTLFFSFGGSEAGVMFANHGLTWIGLVAGKKLWHVAPGSVPRPARNPECNRDRPDVVEGTMRCLQSVGEVSAATPQASKHPKVPCAWSLIDVVLTSEPQVILLPTAWWHATCNIDPFTVGIGGQDSCDLGCVEEAVKNDSVPFCHDLTVHTRCWDRTRWRSTQSTHSGKNEL